MEALYAPTERGCWVCRSLTSRGELASVTGPDVSAPSCDVLISSEVDQLGCKSANVDSLVLQRRCILTDTHLGIVMEYASGGSLFDHVAKA